MTTIIRSDAVLSRPMPGMQLLPSLGISGIMHRWHGDTARGSINGSVTEVGDAAGGAHLGTVEGQVILRETNGRRYIDLGVGDATRNRISGGGAKSTPDAFTLAALVYFEPSWSISGAAASVLATQDGNSHGIGVSPAEGKVSAYAGGAILATSAVPAGWHSVVVSYNRNGVETITVDNGAPVQGEVHGNTFAAMSAFGLVGRPALKVRFLDAAVIGHELTAAQRGIVHTALLAQKPS